MLSLVYENPWTTVFFADCCQLLPYQYYWRMARPLTTINTTQTGTLNAGFFYAFFPYFLPFLALHALLHLIACVFLPRHV